MAMIMCPECGKEISDKADVCPNCGFGVKHYLENEREKKRNKEKLKENYENELRQLETYFPRKKYFIDVLFDKEHNGWLAIFLTIVMGLGAIACLLIFILGEIKVSTVLLFIVCLLLFFTGAEGGIHAAYRDFQKITEAYNEEMSNLDNVKAQKKEELLSKYNEELSRIERTDFMQKKQSEQEQKQNYGLKCPVCGSIKVKRLSNTSRAISVAAVGLASSKIGKQYECMSCNHKW